MIIGERRDGIGVYVSTKPRGIRDKENSMGDRVAFCTSCQHNRPQNRSTDPLVPIPSSNHIVVFATPRTANLTRIWFCINTTPEIQTDLSTSNVSSADTYT